MFGAVAQKMTVGADTLRHGMVVQASGSSSSYDSLKVVRSDSGCVTAIGVVYNPWCDTCAITSGDVYVVTSGVTPVLVNSDGNEDTTFYRYGNAIMQYGMYAKGFANAVDELADSHMGHTVGGWVMKSNAGYGTTIPVSGRPWTRYYVKVAVQFR
jgi:hypothetical protein